MNSEEIRVGVIGVGSIGKNHARICSEIRNGRFTAIFDINPAVAREISGRYRVKAVSDLNEFINEVDAATVAAPTSAHFDLGRALLEAGKHVLIEKPITESPEQAEELVRLAESRSLVLQVGHVERFNPVLGALEQLLTRPRFIEAHRLSPYPFRSVEIGVVLDLMIHDLEVILHLVRSPVAHVDAVGVPILSRGEDIANARIRFQNGCVANITASRISVEKMRKIRVFQDHPATYLSLDYQNQAGEFHRLINGRIVREKVAIEKDEPLLLEIQSFVDCARQGLQPVVSGSEASAALRLAIDITEQIADFTKAERASLEAARLEAPGGMNVYVIAGESSGDAHAAVLMSELQQLEPDVQFYGAGGPKMSAVGGPRIFEWTHEAVVGVWDVAMKYPYFRRQFYRMHAEIKELRPDIVLFVDYPGFNLRLSRHLRRTGYKGKLVYYISPQVWAWYRGRIQHMAKFLDLMMCIFPFEKVLYEAAGLRAEFVGHPMIETLSQKRLAVARDPDLVGLFPGSREREVRRILPIMLASAKLLRERKPDFRFDVSAASERLKGLIHEILSQAGEREWLVEVRRATELMQRATVGLVASGTATMEASFFELPFVLLYKVAWTTFIPGRLLVRVRYLGMPNILAAKPIIPEFIQHQAVPKNIAAAVWRLYSDPVARKTQIEEMHRVIQQVESVPAGGRPAAVLLRFARGATHAANTAPAR